MKILMVNKFLFPKGGSETYIFKLGAQLQKLGHEVQYFGMEHEGRCVSNHAEQYTKDMDFHTTSTLTKLTYPLKTVYSTEAKKKMLTVLNDFQPDIVHLNNFNYQLTPSIIYAVKSYEKKTGKRVKIVYTAHDYQLVCPEHLMLNNNSEVCEKCLSGSYINCIKGSCIHGSRLKSIVGAAEGKLYRTLKTYKYIDCVICPSEFLKTKLDCNPDLKGKTTVLRNFTESIEKSKTQKQGYVLYFGRYEREKGIETLIKADSIPFVFAGSGEYEEQINSCSHIKNVGYKTGKELETLIRQAVCSVAPSTCYENCPFSVMESIMYGTPVVGADIGGIPELISDGETGFLFESGNVEALSAVIRKITDNRELAEKMSDACLNFSFDTVEEYTDKLLQIYCSEK